MKNKKIKTAVIGCGRVSRTAHYDAIRENENLEFMAVCDLDSTRADYWARENNVRAYYSIEEMLTNEDLDLVSINTPNGTHAELGIKAARQGVNVIVEKPLDMTIQAADSLLDECRLNKVQLFNVLQNRYNDTNKLLKSCVEKGRFGKLIIANVSVNWRREMPYYTEDNGWRSKKSLAGGVFTNQCIHYIDMLQWLVDSRAISVYSRMSSIYPIEVEDYGAAIIHFKNGVIATLTLSNHAYPEDLEGSITLSGEKGMVRLGGKSMNRIVWWEFSDKDIEDELIRNAESTPPTVYGYGHREFYNCVAKSLLGIDSDNLVITGTDGRASVELLDALYRSAESESIITLD